MLVNWAYVPRKNIIQSLDPRARILFMVCCLLALGFVPQLAPSQGVGVWDMRLILFFLIISVLQIVLAQLRWKQIRRFWIVITVVALMLSIITLLTGRGALEVYDTASEHPLWSPSLNLFGSVMAFTLTAERLAFLISQILRIITFAALSVVIPYTIDPSLYGITFKRLGLGDKIAYAMEMAFRFIPTLGRDLQITMDAQRARGFEMDGGKGKNIFKRIAGFAPLLIPVMVGSVVEGEEITDAMDLRAFGVGPRTWLPQLHYRAGDIVYILFGVLIVAATIVAKRAGYGGLWIPPGWIS